MNCCWMISIGFRIMLLLATVGLLVNCAIRFIQNHSTASFDYKTYHKTTKDVYPSLSLCFTGMGIYDADKLKQIYGIDNVYEYQMYLRGEMWNETMVNVDYDHVTDHLKDSFNEIDVAFDLSGNMPAYKWVNQDETSNGTYEPEESDVLSSESFPLNISQRSALTKCFTFDVSKKTSKKAKRKIIRRFNVSLNVTRSMDVSFALGMHYPGQTTRAIPVYSEVDQSMSIFSGNVSAKLVIVGVTEIIRRRESSKESCNPDSAKTDEFVYKKMAENLECKPSHWKEVDHPNICNTTEAMKKSNFVDRAFVESDDLEPPCDELQDVDVDANSYLRGKLTNSLLNLLENPQSANFLVCFTRSIYREVTHVRGYNFEGFIGNGGGYVGLFLGFSIWQFPDFCYLVYNFFITKMDQDILAN